MKDSMTYETIRVDENKGVLTATLDRPDVHNAFNSVLITEAVDLFSSLERWPSVRAVVLAAVGPNFCAGADLNWMSTMVSFTREENIRDSALLAKMFSLMNESPLPLIGRIQGAAIGGGVGLVSVCDLAFATSHSKFGLSEVKLGILPAVISPYVIAKIGESHARALFLTGERFSAERAAAIGLIHGIAKDEGDLDRFVDESLTQIRGSGPDAVRACKKLIRFVAKHPPEESVPYSIEAIADRRVSEEGQGGMKAFLQKEKAPWVDR